MRSPILLTPSRTNTPSNRNSQGKEENPNEADFRESPSLEYADFPPPLLTSTLLVKVKDAEGVLEAALAIREAQAKKKGVKPSNLDHDPLALNESRFGASGQRDNRIKRENKQIRIREDSSGTLGSGTGLN
jgi:hypothetical protein